jgi:hypothetical protein
MRFIRHFFPVVLVFLPLQSVLSDDTQSAHFRKHREYAAFPNYRISNLLLDHFQKELGEGEFIVDDKLSQNELVVAVLLDVSVSGGSDYSKVLIAHIDKEQTKVTSEFFYLPYKEFKTEAGQPWVSELGQISNHGNKILLKVGRHSLHQSLPIHVLTTGRFAKCRPAE